MAPEQAGGYQVDERSDVYGLATTLYHLLTGRIYPPLEPGDDPWTMVRKVREHGGPRARTLNPDVDEELDAILARALSKRPEDRHPRALAFADELARWIDARSRPPAELQRADDGLVAGRYRLLRPLAHGGFGTVFLALDTHTSAEVVLKQQDVRNPRVRAMMARSALIQSRVHHPLIVPVFDFGDEAGRAFLVMRWVRDARTLDQIELPVRDKVRLVRDAAAAIHDIHELGYYRLDLKPSNALVTGRPPMIQLVDFDLALHADDPDESGHGDDDEGGALITGTMHFMSPEQFRGDKRLDRRTDVFSLGVTLYHVLSGSYPFPHSSFIEMIAGLLENRLVDLREVAPAVDAGLARIVMRCLAYDPADRFPTMLDLAGALTDWLGAAG
jgi:serine/threonine-protein kinase